MWEAHDSQSVCGACCPDGTFNEPVDVLPLYIGVGLQVLPLLRFHKTLCLLQFPFSCASINFSFTGIIEDPSTAFNFLVSFLIFCLYRLLCVCVFFFFFWLCLLNSFGLNSFCFFLWVRTSFAGGVLVMMLQAMCGVFLGL